MHMVAAREWTRHIGASRWTRVVGGVVECCQALVPKHALPLVGVGSVAAYHELEIVVVLLIAGKVIELVIEANVVAPNESWSTHVGAVEDVDPWCKWHFCRCQSCQWNLYGAE